MDGTSLNLRLSLLHSNSYDIEEMYGVDNDLLYSKDLSGMEPNSSDEDEVRIRIPASVFKKFGYDAVRLSIEDADGNAIDRTDDEYIQMNAPMNIRLNGGNAVVWASGNGIVLGYDDKHFGPNDNVTREQMAAMLYRYARYKAVDVSAGEDTNILSYTDFADISEYAVPAIQYASGAGIINGFEDGTLRPTSNATRAQLATILNKAAELFK